MGGLLAGIEPRIQAFGLMVGDGGLVSHFTAADGTPLTELNRLSEEEREAWLELMEPIEPIRFVGRAAPAHLFFQNALRDEAVAREDALAYQAAGSEPKQIEWYESSHFCQTRHSCAWRIGLGLRLALMQVGLPALKLSTQLINPLVLMHQKIKKTPLQWGVFRCPSVQVYQNSGVICSPRDSHCQAH